MDDGVETFVALVNNFLGTHQDFGNQGGKEYLIPDTLFPENPNPLGVSTIPSWEGLFLEPHGSRPAVVIPPFPTGIVGIVLEVETGTAESVLKDGAEPIKLTPLQEFLGFPCKKVLFNRATVSASDAKLQGLDVNTAVLHQSHYS